MYDFNGQTAIVTGGARGIGRAITESLLEAGAHVVAIYSRSDQDAQDLLDDNKSCADRLETVKLDVANYSACEAFQEIFAASGKSLEILVNCAGVRRDAVVGMMRQEYWRNVLETNLGGTFNMCKLAVKAMIRNRYGRIINVTSPISHMGMPGQANYAASKAGQVGFTKSMAKEVARRNITVNCLSPGFVDTAFIGDLPEQQVDEYKKQVPMRRFATPMEVAHCAMFLASREASYVSGATLEVTGGL